MTTTDNIFHRANKKPILWDAFFQNDGNKKPLVIFCHGYKGFKDWGAWNVMAEKFAKQGSFFVKFNFSHNGGTMEDPIDFPDLEAFAENNYTKELGDLKDMLDFFLTDSNQYEQEIDQGNVTLIGHSRGGGIAILKASEDTRITKLITWAAVSDFGKRSSTSGNLEQWQRDGVKYVLNGRTKQRMPHNIQFYKDFKRNEDRLHIESAEKRLTVPHLIVHGKEDDAVSFKEAESLHRWNRNSQLLGIEEADHVFNTKHPWGHEELSEALQIVVEKSLAFLKFD